MKNNEDYQALLNFAEYEMKTYFTKAEEHQKAAARLSKGQTKILCAREEGAAAAYFDCAERMERMIKRIKGVE